MHCPSCGQTILPDSRFCSGCGAAVAQPMPPQSIHSKLLRPRSGRMVAGVCAAFARTYGWNVTLFRILLVVLTPFHLGLGFLAYVVAWIVIPEEPLLVRSAPSNSPPLTSI